jgi:type IV secretion system protein TrbL
MSTVSAGLSGVARAAGNAATASLSDTLGLSEAVASGRTAAREAFSGAGRSETSSAAQSAADETPPWARTLRAEQSARQHRHAAVQALREGDRGGASATPDISEKED